VLILGRRVGESIVIDGGITIVVLACDRGGVRLGVRAPAEVTILRGEIVDQVTAENRRAAAPAGEVARALARRCARRPAEPGGGASA
jgi:carbon storage regulator